MKPIEHDTGEGRKPVGNDRAPVVCVASRTITSQVETFVANHVANLPFDCRLLYGSPLPRYDAGAGHLDLMGRSDFLRALPVLWREVLRLRRKPLFEAFHRVAIARHLRRTRARVVLAEFGWTGVAMLAACRKAGVPMVVHFHGVDAYQRDVLKENATNYRELFAFASAIVAVSRDMERQLEALGAPPEKIHRIVYGIDTELFRGAHPQRAPPVFLAVGRFVEKKAPHLTLLAFAAVARQEPTARLTMIGNGPLLGPCQAMAQAMGIADRVEFPGVFEPAAVAGAMAGARAFVQHSLRAVDGDSEGTPVAILEAQAAGLPVVATRHAGIPDIVVDGETGALVAERDVDAMAASMLRLARDPALAATWGAAGQRRVRESFPAHKSLAELAAVIAKLIAERRPGSGGTIGAADERYP